MVTSNTKPLETTSGFKEGNARGRIVVHVLLLIYAAVLTYVVGGLVFHYNVNPDIFFGLSFALLFFALGQCVYELGLGKAFLFFLITSIVGFGVEVLGTNTGLPFGKYSYGDFLGEKIFGVPLVVPLVWFVIVYVTFSITLSIPHSMPQRSLAKSSRMRSALPIVVLASFGAVAWDLMVDPMFSTYGYWTWETPSGVPTLSGVPLSNFLGWFVVTFLMLVIFVSLTTMRRGFSGSLRRTGNSIDSKIAYVLLMIDAAVANETLDHYVVVLIGVAAMCTFLILTSSSRVGARIRHDEINTQR